MRIVDVIARKRDGNALTRDVIDAFVAGVTDGTVPDYQASALLMAIMWRGMTAQETAWLTEAMANSGERVDLSDIPGIKVGKHSTGGVGDKVSIVLAPIAAACGAVVPKMSGRGLGHTGGTLDKLESIPGFRIDLSMAEFKGVLRKVGAAIIGQTKALAPADKRLYTLRDVTATVESVPLIASSIMSKKLAEGSNALVLDVKSGDGAFMKTYDQSRELAEAMVAIGAAAGVRTEAFITSMDAPLGNAVGNSLEIVECIETLKGNGPSDLTTVTLRIAARMLVLAGVEADGDAAAARVEQALASGKALETFARMVEAQGGNAKIVDDTRLLPVSKGPAMFRAARGGYITAMKAEPIGRATNELGAGRATVADTVDHSVGIVLRAKPGDLVREGDPLIELYHRHGRGLDPAFALCEGAFEIGDAPPVVQPAILGEVR